jgi:hypothetical protein
MVFGGGRWKEGEEEEEEEDVSFVGEWSLQPNVDGYPSFAVEILTLYFINKACYVSVWFQ